MFKSYYLWMFRPLALYKRKPNDFSEKELKVELTKTLNDFSTHLPSFSPLPLLYASGMVFFFF